MTDTPETDANDDAWAYDVQYGTFSALIDSPVEWREFARKLERERDEAMQLLRNIRSGWGGLVTVDGCDCSDCDFLRPIDVVLTKYPINQND